MTGYERFSNYTGYASTYKFESDFIDNSRRDSLGRKLVQMVAMDAIPYYGNVAAQYLTENITRDLNKSYISFLSDQTSSAAISTGNWGCGAFGGNPHLKFVIQLMAASTAKRSVVYFTFFDQKLKSELEEIYSRIKTKSVSQVFHLLSLFKSDQANFIDLYKI